MDSADVSTSTAKNKSVGLSTREWKTRASADNNDLKVIDYEAKNISASSSLKRMKVLTVHKSDLREGTGFNCFMGVL